MNKRILLLKIKLIGLKLLVVITVILTVFFFALIISEEGVFNVDFWIQCLPILSIFVKPLFISILIPLLFAETYIGLYCMGWLLEQIGNVKSEIEHLEIKNKREKEIENEE